MFILLTQPYIKIRADQFSQTQKESMEQTYNIYSKLSKSLYFKSICSSYFCTFDINTTVSTLARYLLIDVWFCARSRKHILSKRKQVHTSDIAHSQLQTDAICDKIDIHIKVLTIEVYGNKSV